MLVNEQDSYCRDAGPVNPAEVRIHERQAGQRDDRQQVADGGEAE